MAQYIDKSALVAEIESLKDNVPYFPTIAEKEAYRAGVYSAYCKVSSLKEKEVDLEEEIERVRKTHFINDDFEKATLEGRQITNIAKHFFELGLKAQNKITPLQQQRISVMKMEFWTGLQTFNESEMTLSDAYNKGIEDVLEELGLKI